MKIVKKYEFFTKTITKLENESLSTKKQMQHFENAIVKIDDDFLNKKFDKLVSKNSDLTFFMNYCSINCSSHNQLFSRVPLSTTIVERTFSYLKNILYKRRSNLKVL
jgi:hypothetical protein